MPGESVTMKNFSAKQKKDKAAQTPVSASAEVKSKIGKATLKSAGSIDEKSLIEAMYSEDDFNSCW